MLDTTLKFDLAAFPQWAAAHLRIIPDEPDDPTLPERYPDFPLRGTIPFDLFCERAAVQLALFRRIEKQYNALGRVDMQILKARQMGVSTLIQALKFYFMLHNRFRNGMTIAHKDNSTQYIFNMQKTFYENCDVKPEFRRWNRAGIDFNDDEGNGLNNQIFIETAGSTDVGRAFTIHFLHCSEVASWDKLVDKKIDVSGLFGGLNQAIRDRKGTFKFIESTAQGEGYFKQMWYDGPRNRDNVFLPWVVMPIYRIDVTEVEAEEIANTPDRKWGDEIKEAERIRAILRDLTSGIDIEHEVFCRLAWRRHMIRDECEGKLAIFRQEYPTVVEDAFSSANFSAFDSFYLNDRLTEVADRRTGAWIVPVKRISFFEEECRPNVPGWWTQAFKYDQTGDICEFIPVEPGAKYVIGADACYGTSQDEAAFVVWRLPDLIEVCSYHGSIDADEFGEMLFVVGYGYNKALIAPEIQGPGLSTLHTLEKLNYPNLYRMDSLNKYAKKKQLQHGFYNNRASKPLLAGVLRQAIRERKCTLHNPDFIGQLQAFHEMRSGGTQKFEAAPGFRDDMVIAGGIGIYISGLVVLPKAPQSSKNPKSIASMIAQAQRQQNSNSWLSHS